MAAVETITVWALVDSAGAPIDYIGCQPTIEDAERQACALWAQGIEAYTIEAPSAVYALPPRFYFDHAARDLAAGIIERETARLVYVRLDAADYRELESDAAHYADSMRAAGYDDIGMISSARATLRRLRAAGEPQSS